MAIRQREWLQHTATTNNNLCTPGICSSPFLLVGVFEEKARLLGLTFSSVQRDRSTFSALRTSTVST